MFKTAILAAHFLLLGKWLLQELQEATQSHQVHKSDAFSKFLSNVTKSESNNTAKVNRDTANNNRMSLLLIEDVDIVYEQDEGFLSALGQLLSTSKRPIILTTSNPSNVHVQKFVSQYRTVSFKPLPGSVMATFLQIMCLIEGIAIDSVIIHKLLGWNNGDIRRTILQLQYWVQSCDLSKHIQDADSSESNKRTEKVVAKVQENGELSRKSDDEDEQFTMDLMDQVLKHNTGALDYRDYDTFATDSFPSKSQVRLPFLNV